MVILYTLKRFNDAPLKCSALEYFLSMYPHVRCKIICDSDSIPAPEECNDRWSKEVVGLNYFDSLRRMMLQDCQENSDTALVVSTDMMNILSAFYADVLRNSQCLSGVNVVTGNIGNPSVSVLALLQPRMVNWPKVSVDHYFIHQFIHTAVVRASRSIPVLPYESFDPKPETDDMFRRDKSLICSMIGKTSA